MAPVAPHTRRSSADLAATLVAAVGLALACAGSPEASTWRSVYAEQAWYQERTEPERIWAGTLRPREIVEGPGARTALRYELRSPEHGVVPIYDPGRAIPLRAAAGNNVEIRGKLVDLTAEGFTIELWPGHVAW